MTIYCTVYTGKKEIWTEDGDTIRQLGNGNMFSRYREKVGYYGNIYSIGQMFTTEDAARRGWNREPVSVGEIFNPFTGHGFESENEYRETMNKWLHIW